MKSKKTVQTFICILLAVLTVSLTACRNDKDTGGQIPPVTSTAYNRDNPESSVDEEKTHQGIESDEPEQEPIYYHAAICGAVVTEQDGSTTFSYVKKCENCGKVQSGSCIANVVGGVLHGSFLCSGCKELQQFEIETTQS